MANERSPGAGIYKVCCPCGVEIKVDLKDGSRTQSCPACDLTLTFVVQIDPRTKRTKVAVVVPKDAVVPAGKTGETQFFVPFPEPESPDTSCACGQSLLVNKNTLASLQTCPACGATYRIAIKTDPKTKDKVAILVPVGRETKSRGRGGPRSRATARPKPETEEAPPPGKQAATCPCGKRFFVGRHDLGKEETCPSCRKTVVFREVRDPQTLAPTIRIDLVEEE